VFDLQKANVEIVPNLVSGDIQNGLRKYHCLASRIRERWRNPGKYESRHLSPSNARDDR
jgi:hypothetical protein